MRLIETHSRWGETYKTAHFVNGRKTSEKEYDDAAGNILAKHPHPSMARKMESTSYGFRLVLEDF